MAVGHLPYTRRIAAVWTVTLALVGAACGAEGTSSVGSSPSEMGGMDHGDGSGGEEYAFGRPAGQGEADRTVLVAQTDMLQFAPSQVSVGAGETVKFVITNLGLVPHEFVLGDERYQQRHAREMSEMGEMLPPDEPNAVALEPNESAEIVWTFTDPGVVLYGCHLAGHYEAGMVGEITVEA